MSERNAHVIARQCREILSRAEQLRGRLMEKGSAESAPLLRDALEVLEETSEQLQVAGEEIRVQNEELESTRSAAEEQYHRYLDLFDSAPDGYLVTDGGGVVQEVNRAAAEMLNVPLRYVNGRPLAIFVDESDRREFRQTLLSLREGRGERDEWEVCLKPMQKDPFPAAVTVSAQSDPDGRKILRWLVRDVTERKEAEAAFRREHSITQTLQRAFLPDPSLRIPGVEVGHLYAPARNDALVGGDFYDLFPVGEGRYGIVMGDVCGKGVKAVETAAMTKYMLRALASQSRRPSDVMRKLNELLCDYLPEDRFVTLFFGIYDPPTGGLAYVNAGHESPVLEDPAGAAQLLHATGSILGILGDTDFEQGEAGLPPGSSLLTFTDGLTEARHEGAFLDLEGVAEFFERSRHEDPQKRVLALMREVQLFNREPLRDDAAVLLLSVSPDNAPVADR